MPYGSRWSEQFVRQLSDKEVRSEFAADQMRARIALLIRSLREQPDRNWTQAELGEKAGKPQNVISRFEDPNYGKMSLQSLFDIAAAFDLPVWIDLPEWEDWLRLIDNVPSSTTRRSSFDLDRLAGCSFNSSADGSIAASGAAASAAAESIRNMVLGPPQLPQILSAPVNANALSTSNEEPHEKIDSAMGNAVVARSVAA
ncbi:helix-turn-helix transcriptional regulator [Bradyrhizobium sp.]|uniref:helix-turn-helix transcriptional regulator n=1 Tax=Bradyrhizobium sp. TaxID=376 RepID=UPI002C5DC428|nr:helix-turn-helix transcriptional regulator [Bradyrhizobium sp.]HMM92631.1 helix-turn-helix transcriptional regulator [Bradyrhizobium sp.]